MPRPDPRDDGRTPQEGPEPWFKVLAMLQQNWAAIFARPEGGVTVHFFDDHADVFDTLEFDSVSDAEGALEFNGFVRLSEEPGFAYVAGVPSYPLKHSPRALRRVYSGGEYWKVPPPGHRPRGPRVERSMQRFIDAQDPVLDTVFAELAAGRKETHWMWFIFPQLKGLGTSQRSRFFGLADTFEAMAYLATPVLRSRLERAFELVLQHPDRSAQQVFGVVDAMKLHACATLFSVADPQWDLPARVIDTFFGGKGHPKTLSQCRD